MVKVLVLDFDDTLYLHGKKIWCDEELTNKANKGEDVYKDSIIPGYMRALVDRAILEAIPIYCLTWVLDSTWVDIKQAKIDKDFGKGVIKVIGSSTPEHKIKVLRTLADKHDCAPSGVLFIDDLYATWQDAEKAGFVGACPQYIEAFGVEAYLPFRKVI